MSDRASARHRSPQRAATPLSDIGGAVTGQFGALGRGGAVVAVSTGLVAAGGVTATAAQAAQKAAAQNAAVDAAAFAGTGSAFAAPLLASSPNLTASSAALTAPTTATVSFETGAFKAVPKPAAAVEATAAGAYSTSENAAKSGNAKYSVAPGSAAKGSSVLAVAARYVGIAYRYGGTTPSGFDCSGYTGYVYRQLGVSLPRTANQQMLAAKRISRSQAKPGDLVFFVSGGRAYHNGIYAGGNMMYDSPRSGKSIQKREIWSASVVFGRVTG